MGYVKATCEECGQSVLSKDGRAIDHLQRSTGFQCIGSGEPVDDEREVEEAPAAALVLDIVPPAAFVPAPLPVMAERAAPVVRVARSAASSEVAKPAIRAEVEAARERIKYSPPRGSIDFDKLKDCNCPSLRAAIREYLDGGSIAFGASEEMPIFSCR